MMIQHKTGLQASFYKVALIEKYVSQQIKTVKGFVKYYWTVEREATEMESVGDNGKKGHTDRSRVGDDPDGKKPEGIQKK